jgi:hypothetical protein
MIIENMVDLNILRVGEGHNLPRVTITDKGRVCLRLLLCTKKSHSLKQNGLYKDLDYKSTLEFYLSCDLELLETHMLSNNFHLF